MRRAIAIAFAFAFVVLMFAACGGRQDSPEVPPDRPSGATRDLRLPEPVRAVAAYRVELNEAVPDSVRE